MRPTSILIKARNTATASCPRLIIVPYAVLTMSGSPSTTKITNGQKSLEQLQKWLPQAEYDEQDNGNWKYKNNEDLAAKVMPLLRDLGLHV
jgi:hypothetical protein